MKVVINRCFGGFGLSRDALQALGYGDNEYPTIERNDPRLVAVVEKMGPASYGMCAALRVVEIPDDVDWQIDEYDGLETIHEAHRVWGDYA